MLYAFKSPTLTTFCVSTFLFFTNISTNYYYFSFLIVLFVSFDMMSIQIQINFSSRFFIFCIICLHSVLASKDFSCLGLIVKPGTYLHSTNFDSTNASASFFRGCYTPSSNGLFCKLSMIFRLNLKKINCLLLQVLTKTYP